MVTIILIYAEFINKSTRLTTLLRNVKFFRCAAFSLNLNLKFHRIIFEIAWVRTHQHVLDTVRFVLNKKQMIFISDRQLS